MVHDADELVRCRHCGREAFVVAQMRTNGGVSDVPLCADCFARVEPEILAAARDPAAAPPVARVIGKPKA